MALLHIYDSSWWSIRQTAKLRIAETKLPISNMYDLKYELDQLKKTGKIFDRILFETHGEAGKIFFDHVAIDRYYWNDILGRYNSLTAPSARIYFNGCNVAEGVAGWEFLKAAALVFMSTGNGEVFGQTSIGFANYDTGHTVHYWGDTRTVRVKDGAIISTSEK